MILRIFNLLATSYNRLNASYNRWQYIADRIFEQREGLDWWVELLVLNDLPFAFEAPHLMVDTERYVKALWFRLVNPEHLKCYRGQHRDTIVASILNRCPLQLKELLVRAKDDKEREILGLADKKTKEAIYKLLFFCGRYALDEAKPVHVSQTSILLSATDHNAVLQYADAFDYIIGPVTSHEPDPLSHKRSFSRSGSAITPKALRNFFEVSFHERSRPAHVLVGLTIDQVCAQLEDLGFVHSVEDGWKRRSAILDKLKKVLKWTTELTMNSLIGRADFIRLCAHELGETKPVVLKFMRHKVRQKYTVPFSHIL